VTASAHGKHTLIELKYERKYAASEWNGWRLETTNYTLDAFDTNGHWLYGVDLERCTTSAEVLDWIMQVAGKQWATPELMSGLLCALRDVLNPQATLCSCGRSKRLTKSELRSRVDAFALDHPNVVVGAPEFYARLEELD